MSKITPIKNGKKYCHDCHKWKLLRFFSLKGYISKKNPKKKFYKSYCKACIVKRAEAWREAHYKHYLAYQKEWHRKDNLKRKKKKK